MDLALNNLQRLICHKTKQTKLKLSRYGVAWDKCDKLPDWKRDGELNVEFLV